jgi:hypothetical protein
LRGSGATSGGALFGEFASPGENRRGAPNRSVPLPWVGPVPPRADNTGLMPVVVVSADRAAVPAPRYPDRGYPDLDPGGKFHVPTPYGPVVPGAPGSLPFNDPSVSPVRETPQPPRTPGLGPISERFVGPVPEPLPEVVVEARRPPTGRPSLTPSAFFRGAAGLLGYGLAFLFVPRTLNLGENERVRRRIEADIAERLAPVNISVDRLAEPIATVTVSSSRLTDRPVAGAPGSLLGGTLRGPALRRVAAPFVTTPTAFVSPRPQRSTGRRGVQATVQPLGGLIVGQPLPIPGRFVRPPATRPAPRVPAAPRPSVPIPGLPTLSPGLPPGVGVAPDLGLVPSTATQPMLSGGRCVCPRPVTTKDRRKPRAARVLCHQGTYTETSFGLIKSPRKEIPCQ